MRWRISPCLLLSCFVRNLYKLTQTYGSDRTFIAVSEFLISAQQIIKNYDPVKNVSKFINSMSR